MLEHPKPPAGSATDSVPKQGASIVEIDNIGNVVEDDTPQTYTTIAAAEVIGVMTLAGVIFCMPLMQKQSNSNNQQAWMLYKQVTLTTFLYSCAYILL